MKKSIFLLAFVVLSAVSFSCSSDSGGSSTGGDVIVGNWKMTGYYFDGQVYTDEIDPCYDVFYKFNSNGKGKFTEKDCEDIDEVINFNWEKSSGDYYTFYNEMTESQDIKVIFKSDNKVMWMYDIDTEDSAAIFEKQ